MCPAGWANHRLELAGQTECPPTNAALDGYSVCMKRGPGGQQKSDRKQTPTLRFAPFPSDPIFTAENKHPRQNRKVGIALRFCLGCLLLAVKNGSGGKGANRKVGIAYNPTSRGHPLAKRAQGRTPKSAFKCGAPCQTRKSCNPNRKHQSTCDMTFACPCSRPLKSQQP